MHVPQFVIAMGNPADGFEYIGPFTLDAANEYAERHLDKSDYWIIMLQEPATGEGE